MRPPRLIQISHPLRHGLIGSDVTDIGSNEAGSDATLASDQAPLHPISVTSDPMRPDPISLMCHYVGPNDHVTDVTLSLVSSGASDIGSSVVGLWRIGPQTSSGGLEQSLASS